MATLLDEAVWKLTFLILFASGPKGFMTRADCVQHTNCPEIHFAVVKSPKEGKRFAE